jgi:hypothetical protein
MLVGTVAALANGMSQPLMTVVFGDVIDAFGGATTANVLHRVNKVSHITSLAPSSNALSFHGSLSLRHVKKELQLSSLCITSFRNVNPFRWLNI